MEPLPHTDVASVHCDTNILAETSKQNIKNTNNVTTGRQTKELQKPVHYRRLEMFGLYETKLLTLFLLRLLSNKVEFYLGANISGVGALDDVCFKYKPANSDKYVVVFLQAKHKVNPDKNKLKMSDLLSYDGGLSIQKYFDSYLMIRQRFTPMSKDILFKSTYDETQCYFVVYTSAKHDIECVMRPLEHNEINDNVKDLIQTNVSGDIFQLEYKHFEFLTKQHVEKNIRQLAKIFFAYLMKRNARTMRGDFEVREGLIKMYQVVLAQCVVEVISHDAEVIHYKFRRKFFNSKDNLITIFRESLFKEVVNYTAFKKKKPIKDLVSSMLDEDTTADSNSRIIGNVLEYNDDLAIRNAVSTKGKELLENLTFSFPISLENSDLSLRGTADKIERRLNYLVVNILKLMKHAVHYSDGLHFVHVNESMVGPEGLVPRGVLEHNGGLGSALGNLLVVDSDTGALKFNACSPLPKHANTLWNKLKQEHDEHLLFTYRFKFRIDCFPKASFQDNFYEEYLAKDFIRRFWLCTGQDRENEVECKTKEEITSVLKSQNGKKSALRPKSYAIFLVLHDLMQKWWMMSGTAYYLTEHTKFLQNAMSEVVSDLLLSTLSRIYLNKLRGSAIEFAKDAVKSLGLDETIHDLVMIVTDSVTLTAVKLMQHYIHSQSCTFIDYNHVTSLMYGDLADEVTKINVQAIVITCKEINYDMNSICEALAQFIQGLPRVNITVIIDAKLSEALKQELTCAYHEVRDDKNGLIDLSPSSKKKILSKCKIIYPCQGEELIFK